MGFRDLRKYLNCRLRHPVRAIRIPAAATIGEMAARRPPSDLGAREDWISPFQASRAEEHASRESSDSTCYPADINGYRSGEEGGVGGEGRCVSGEGRVLDEGSVPGSKVGDVPGRELDRPVPIEDRDSRRRLRRTDQVNVRLTTPQFQALARAGDLYGLSPTEMARLFINRGARAVLTGR